jgi:hypothetical protein
MRAKMLQHQFADAVGRLVGGNFPAPMVGKVA